MRQNRFLCQMRRSVNIFLTETMPFFSRKSFFKEKKMNKLIYSLLSLLVILTNPAFSVEDHHKLNEKRKIENIITLKSGATLEIPKGFHAEKVDKTNEVIKLDDPEKALTIFFVETEGKDLSKAMEQAWKRVEPS